MTDALKPCPFCAGGKTDIHPNGRMWTGQRLSEPTSVSIRHWCEDVAGQPHRMIERVGRDEAAAIEAWNRRAALAAPPVALGWVLVPVDLSEEMMRSLAEHEFPGEWDKATAEDKAISRKHFRAWWAAMLDAAPGAPDAQELRT